MRRLVVAALAAAACSFTSPSSSGAQSSPKSTNPDSVLQALQQAATSTAPATTAREGAYSFADLRWGATKAEAKSKLGRLGFRFGRQDEDGDLQFSGSILGQRTAIYAQFAGDRLVEVLVDLATDGDQARPVYDEMREALIHKYGAPHTTVENFADPYQAGDGHEQDALRAGKARIGTVWINEAAGRRETLSLGIMSDLSVAVSYESPEWAAEAKARAAKATKVF